MVLKTRVSFLFARCRPTQPRCGVDPSVGLNDTSAARVGTVVRPVAATAASAAAAAAAAAADDDTALGNMLNKK